MPRRQPQGESYSYRGALIRETDKALCIELDEYPSLGSMWFPKSQCEWRPDGGEARGVGGTLFVPEWLARDKDILP